jgi:hypothetical protein
MRLTASIVALAFAWTSVTASAGAQDAGVTEDRARQLALVREADRAENEARPADAVALWRQALVAAPTSRLAGRCETRLAYLAARSERGYAPLADLMRMRRLSTSALSAQVLDGYARRLDGYPHGRARREGRELVADAWLGRLGDANRGRLAYQRWLAEPGVEGVELRLAASGLSRAYAQLGDSGAALAAMERVGLGASNEAKALRLRSRRGVLRAISWSLLGAFMALGLALGGYRGLRLARLRSALTPMRLAAGAWVLLGPLLIAWRFDRAATDTFVTLALAGAAVLLVAAVFGAGLVDAPASPRRAVAAAAFAAMFGAGFLVLERAGFLLGLGL